ncbi:MAG: phage tail tape measure protein [Clostridium sp.]|nr:phage tail tape measure protein [Acetatifactor muris]MCM1527458.1 phage tail tape measure protein [Bacteroides sp.]MCM1562096.1 phage tail tape measure protein [Clostridium sp.]
MSNSTDTLIKDLDKAGKKGQSLLAVLSDCAGTLSLLTKRAGAFVKAFTVPGDILSAVRDLDTAMTSLQRASRMTARQLAAFHETADDIARRTGTATTDILEQAAAWSRLGAATQHALSTLTEYSAMLAAVSPGMTPEDAVSGLSAVMKAFRMDLETSDRTLDDLLSKINAVGRTRPFGNAEILELLTRSADAMADAGNSPEDTIALGAVLTSLTGDAARAADILNTLSLRTRGYSEDTGVCTADVRELSRTVAELTRTADSPGGVSLFADEAGTRLKSTMELLQDISEIYGELDATRQNSLSEFLGREEDARFSTALLEHFDTVTDSMETMARSAGGIETEMAAAADTVEHRLNRLREAGNGILQNILDPEDVKTFLDALLSLGNGLERLTEKTGLFGTVGIGSGLLSIREFVKNFA